MSSSSRAAIATVVLALVSACSEPTRSPTDSDLSLHRDRDRDENAVVVDPSGRHGRPTTIQAGIDLVTAGGRVQVLPGTYPEALVITKGLTLESWSRWGDHHRRGHDHNEEGVIVAPPGAPLGSIDVTGSDPVTIRHLTVLKPGVNGILGTGAVNLTLDDVKVVAVALAPGTNRLVRVSNNAALTGARARLVVRESFLDGGGLAALGVSLQADIDAVIEENVIRRTGSSLCVFVESFGPDGITADIVNNDMDGCEGRTAIDVGPTQTQVTNFGTVGVVNIVGNTIRNSSASCTPTTAIHYQLYTGRIERNSIIGFVQECAAPISDALPSAIWVGSLRGFPAASPVVRFNDIQGNAHAGLRIAPNIANSTDARCNYWGAESGPSGVGLAGTGDAVVVEAGGARPIVAPFAMQSNAGRGRKHDGHHGEHDVRSGDDRDDDENDGGESCRVEYSLWSEPVNLGPIINTAAADINATVTPDELSLYFTSNRPGGQGLNDLYVSRRATPDSPWETPVNLGTVINTPAAEAGASFSPDGRLMFFHSGRPGGHGLNDIYVSYRADPTDVFAWGPPVNLGPQVNTEMDEAGAEYVTERGRGRATLYFNRSAEPVTGLYDIYSVALDRDTPSAVAAPIPELNLPPPASDFAPSLSSNRLELFLTSGRPGTIGGNDLWVSTRRSVRDPWSTPEHLGTPLNTTLNDRQPSLSGGDRILIYASTRPGGFGADDLWMSTRTRIEPRDR